MKFGSALHALDANMFVAREGWNGKGMWLVLIRNWAPNEIYNEACAGLEIAPFIAMRTADEKLVPWLASQTDVLANDWEIV